MPQFCLTLVATISYSWWYNVMMLFYNYLSVGPVVMTTNQTVVSPDTAILNCSATAKPRAEIQWMRDGMVLGNTINNTTKVTIFYDEQGDCIITRQPDECVLASTLILSDTIPDNTGQYVCSASNPAGSDMEAAWLTVHGMLMFVNIHCP